MQTRQTRQRCYRFVLALLIPVTVSLYAGCNSAPPVGGNSSPADDSNTLINDPLGNDGAISGKLFDSQSTRGADTSSAQTIPPEFDTTDTMVSFKDLEGNDLLDENGNPIPPVPLGPDGSFEAQGLPVGTDFTVCGDIGGDGSCDIESCVQIPDDGTNGAGQLGDVRADPLTTIVLAKLREILAELGIDPQDLPVSPAVVVTRVVNAYTNLFDEAGIDDALLLQEIEGLDAQALADIFDGDLPALAQQGVEIVEGNINVTRARDAESLAAAVAEVFLRAGFPVADMPGGADLSALANLDNVETTTPSELYGDNKPFDDLAELPDNLPPDILDQLPPEFLDQIGEGFPDGLPPELLDQLPPEFLELYPDGVPDDLFVAQVNEIRDGDFAEPTIYISTVVEPNRNFVFIDGEGEEGGVPPLPVISDHILVRMAGLHLEGRRISIADLYDLLTSIEDGLGARLVFHADDPNFFGPPLTIFQTADGKGRAININQVMRRIFESGLSDVGADDFDARESQLRNLIREFLGDTLAPEFDRLFDAIVTDRLMAAEELARRIREARAHLPFNPTGPSAFFVVADGDAFRSDMPVSPVTVDADIDPNGIVTSVRHNASGDGMFYLGFGPRTDETGLIELIRRDSGHRIQGARGPVRLSIYDNSLFQAINGAPFADFVSESGSFYPGVNITVFRDEFVPEPAPIGPAPASVEGPNQQIFVLATGIGERGEPVRVDYDRTTGLATYNPGGRYVLQFLPDSEATGAFGLFNEQTGRPAAVEDPDNFFQARPERPEGFEDFFNEVDDFNDYGNFEDPNDFINDVFDPFLGDGQLPPPPPDGDAPPPPDGNVPPPPDGNVPPPPDGEVPPPDGGNEPVPPAQVEEVPGDGSVPNDGAEPPMDGGVPIDPGMILVQADQVVGLTIQPMVFTHVFGTDAPNARYNPEADPYYDDINGNDAQDEGEPTVAHRPTLFNPGDWRSTDIRLYYRRADNNLGVVFDNIDSESQTPATRDGVALVPRNFKPRRNAFRFGRPNTAINLLTAFVPPDFFDGTHDLTRETRVDIFTAIAMVNFVMDQVFNIEAEIDPDGLGPLERRRALVNADIFIVPIGDPFVMLARGFHDRSVPAGE
ncbi:MAG: hypothetical protein J5J06_12085 [Phycisphaerae bacterium]|nr:hypothetical protein [Phycisphaerae bacterium]